MADKTKGADVRQIAKGLHIGIIMDGNGRWAKARGLPRTAGHVKGAKVFETIGRYGTDLGLAAMTFYAFSTENWSRPPEEVDKIMSLLDQYLHRAFDYRKENNKLLFLGERDIFPKSMQNLMHKIENDTKDRTGTILNIAVNYGGRADIVHAARALAEKAAAGVLQPERINEAQFSDHLFTAGQRDPDIILRPSGEKRISNFMLWQSAYSEFIYQDVLWPDYKKKDLDAALLEYAGRTRRFGGVVEELAATNQNEGEDIS